MSLVCWKEFSGRPLVCRAPSKNGAGSPDPSSNIVRASRPLENNPLGQPQQASSNRSVGSNRFPVPGTTALRVPSPTKAMEPVALRRAGLTSPAVHERRVTRLRRRQPPQLQIQQKQNLKKKQNQPFDSEVSFIEVFTLGLRHTLALWQRALALVESPLVQASLASFRAVA